MGCVFIPMLASAEPIASPDDQKGGSGEAGRQALRIVATVDKTTVELGSQLTLTITLDGDVANVNLQPFEFPKALQVVAQSRASNVSLGVGVLKRSVSLIYVLVPQEAGTFRLGPFQVIHHGTPILTDPLDIVVKKPIVPPSLPEHQRYTL